MGDTIAEDMQVVQFLACCARAGIQDEFMNIFPTKIAINISFSNFSVEYRKKDVIIPEKTTALDIANGCRRDRSAEDLLSTLDMDQYGSTPPRTRIKNKIREKSDRRQKM